MRADQEQHEREKDPRDDHAEHAEQDAFGRQAPPSVGEAPAAAARWRERSAAVAAPTASAAALAWDRFGGAFIALAAGQEPWSRAVAGVPRRGVEL
jgi:hypothetical protein